MPVELVFIHGWAFDARFWDALAPKLSQFAQSRVDLGFFGAGTDFVPTENCVLVGHSLGFIHGVQLNAKWRSWIAINSFPRFVNSNEQPGCVTAAALRKMRMQLENDPPGALRDFYHLIGATSVAGTSDPACLHDGLDQLRDCDIEDKIKALSAPGLVLAARNDPLVPLAISERLGGNARLKLHDTGGHLLPQADPDWCAREIAAFVTNGLT